MQPSTLALVSVDRVAQLCPTRDNAGAVAFWEANGFELQENDVRWSLAI